jgi:hypothetical protein
MAAAVLAALLLVSGCGSSGAGSGGGQSKEDAQASKAISDYFVKKQSSGTTGAGLFGVSRKQGDCLGKGWVDRIGTANLKKYGLLTKGDKVSSQVSPDSLKMSTADAKAATDVLFDCTDVGQKVQTAITKQTGMNAAAKACAKKALTDARLRAVFTGLFSGHTDQAQKELTGPLMKCVSTTTG